MRLWCWLPMMVVLVAGIGCSTSPSRTDQVATRQIEYEVLGMDCPGCHGGLEKNLRKVPGVVNAHANWKAQRVVIDVAVDAQVEPGQIDQAIRDSNFTPGKGSQSP